MQRRSLLRCAAAALLASGLSAAPAWGQNKPIRLIVPYAPGGPLDVT
ncbi:MAG TPA: tripartite tricarboxylate transporter substrate binding protein, partial [Ottowia sp.]|nr:tripartite tricarboxylate transporter substrate binding protein [Ottowia sp.]